MPKELKHYIDSDVYTEAKKRIRHVIESFDSVLVAFSGGKDSLAALLLTEEVYRDMGIPQKVKVFFRDEEVIQDEVISFVTEMYKSGRFDFRYYAIPLKSTKFILGTSTEYIQWDRNRKWIRQPPEFAITMSDEEWRPLSQYESDEFICRNEKGKVAIINGIRADESLIRLRSCINKKNENYINSVKECKYVKFVKPIYDWTVRDIFIYFCKNDIKYCDIYDKELWNRNDLRVSTPLHAESAKQFYKQRTLNPTFYEQIISIFPEMLVQERYWNEYDKDQVAYQYEHSFNGIRNYITDTITDPKQRDLALKKVAGAEQRRRKGNPQNMGGYPVLYVFKAVINGQYKREIQPVGTPTKAMVDYEIR